MNKKNIRIMFDIWAGPIWGCYYDEDKKEYDYYIKSISNDKELMKLHQELQDLYSSYYHFDYKGEACYFDKKKKKKDKYKMLDLLEKLRKRLDELDDGTFVIEDRETERVKNL
ncbi:MAG: RNA helicase [Finegoldia magna]|nr:RNA helicase [Finegoldia magna]